MKLWIFVALFLSITLDAWTAQIGKGSFCNHKNGCDNVLTNLICYEGACRCPEVLTMPDAELQPNLNTWWHEAHHKCYAIRGSMCDLHPTKKRVDCLPGMKCLVDPNNPGAFTCSASKFTSIPALLVALLPYLLF